MNGYDIQPGALSGRYPNLFAHELCHSLNLFDEYEETTTEYNEPHGAGPIVEYLISISENVQEIDQMNPAVVLETLKWKYILSLEERSKLLSGDLIYTKDYLVSKGILPNSTVANRKIHSVDPRTDKPLHWSNVFLVEGAKYRSKVYRPHFECKMRFDTYDERVSDDSWSLSQVQGGQRIFGSPEFCRVCNYHIRHHITGYKEFGIGGIDRNRLQLLFDNELMPRIRKSFDIENTVTGSTKSVKKAFCHIASIRGYIILKKVVNPLNIKLNIRKKHVSLYYNGVICDPTFFDLYRLVCNNESITSSEPLGNSELYYQTVAGEKKPFKNYQVDRGFIGTIGEIRAYLYIYRMRKDSYANPYEWPPLYLEKAKDQLMK